MVNFLDGQRDYAKALALCGGALATKRQIGEMRCFTRWEQTGRQ